MRRSEDIGELAAALAKAQGSMPTVAKGSNNPFFNSTYADLADVVEAIRPHLSENGLAVVQMPETQDGKPVVTTMLMHESGQWVMGTLELTVQKNDMQAIGSATTYARRYQYSGAVGAVADADDDGNAASGTTHENVTRSSGVQPGSRAAKDAKPAGAKNTEAMRGRIYAVAESLGMTFSDAVIGGLGEDVPELDLTFAQCRKVNDYLTTELERVA